MKYKLFAIDFDGTIVNSDYPKVHGVKPHAKRVLERIRDNGGKIVIWTSRANIDFVREYLQSEGIPFDKVNEDFDEVVEAYEKQVRKVFADVYIDDRCLLFKEKEIDWLEIEELIF